MNPAMLVEPNSRTIYKCVLDGEHDGAELCPLAEIMLFAEGFGDAKTLSRKMCKLYILCSEQLSQQPHYDYGLRAVKSVLVMAGGLKRANPDISEDLVLIRALRDSNLPKFLADDIPLFFAIIKDLFPGVIVPDNDYGEFQARSRRPTSVRVAMRSNRFVEGPRPPTSVSWRRVAPMAWRSHVCRAQVAMEDEITKAGLQNVHWVS